MQRVWIALAGVAGLIAVGMGAAAAHALAPEAARLVRNGAELNGWHALALFGIGLWAPRGGRWADLAGAAFVLGLLLFCGSVYALAFGLLTHAPLAPVGGTILMLGWALLTVSAVRAR